MLAEVIGANEKYTTKRYINVHIAFTIQKVIRTRLARRKIFVNVGYPKETRQNNPFIKKYATSKFSYV